MQLLNLRLWQELLNLISYYPKLIVELSLQFLGKFTIVKSVLVKHWLKLFILKKICPLLLYCYFIYIMILASKGCQNSWGRIGRKLSPQLVQEGQKGHCQCPRTHQICRFSLSLFAQSKCIILFWYLPAN